LRKYVVTEHVQKTIPVRREEVRVEFEPEDSPPPKDGAPGES
jgi:stress response protein YsnF